MARSRLTEIGYAGKAVGNGAVEMFHLREGRFTCACEPANNELRYDTKTQKDENKPW